MTALLIASSALFLAMFCREVLDRESSRSSGDTKEAVSEEQARMMQSIALSVF
jgi:hypothetical protein